MKDNSKLFKFLPGVPTPHILQRLNKAGGKEVESGKLLSPQSSAALVIDVFGPFIEAPQTLPRLPHTNDLDWPAKFVDIEYSARFPWSGGRHPWLDAVVQTPKHLIGIESKRFEPFRDNKKASFSDAYWRPVWGKNMIPYETLRDGLHNGKLTYKHLDAVQLVKHAFGLRTDGIVRGKGKPILAYVFVDTCHSSPVRITEEKIQRHRQEVSDFAKRAAGSEVRFIAFSYSEWLATFPEEFKLHAELVAQKYNV